MNLAALMAVVMVTTVWAQEKRTEVPAFLTTPDRVESRIGSLEFNDGYPTGETAAKIRDELDYLHGVEAFMNSIQGVSTYAIRKGLMLSLIHISEPTRLWSGSRMPSSA